MKEIIYPTLDLFIYQFRNGLGDSDEQIRENHKDFWQNLPDKIKVNLDAEVKGENPEYIKLLEELIEPSTKKQFNIQDNHYYFKDTSDTYKLEGYYYPIRLYDTYGLIFDCSIDDRKNPQPIDVFKNLKQQGATKSGNVGKTWMVSGSLVPGIKPEPEDIAKETYQILTGIECQKPEQGKFLGATVFEIWKPPQKWLNVEQENVHVLVILYPNLWNMEVAAEFYGDWLRLFNMRNKIIWEYAYSRQLTTELKAIFQTVSENINRVNKINYGFANQKISQQELQELQKILSQSIATLSDYASKLSYLEILRLAIDNNLQNYQSFIKDIEDKAKEKQQNDSTLGDTNLQCLEKFTKTVKTKYKVQIQQDCASLSASLRIIEDLTNTVRGIIEIEQTKRDRSLERTFQVLGTAFGGGAIVSGVVTQHIDKPFAPMNLKYSFHPLVLSLFWSVLATVILGLAAWWLTKPKQKDK
ncbi:hypothetical protein [Calothrix sp. UHCC 0171]|uniref:hypothetical protein n=1 Tax=Calothrix sp. UHCC 0171 TaxID=3110245 RepID=UPI002B220D42|nr:hypothetical protein [Calothrix sp. UHCC 0171]MEA5574075.1 hypothetical protein [Calothrix sp. UHCC 0171]